MVNPVFLYLSIWITVLVLYSFKLTSNLVDMNATGLIMILMNFVSIVVIYYFFIVKNKTKIAEIRERENEDKYIRITTKFANYLVCFWGIVTVLEIIYFRGFPLLWRFNGDPRLYTNFGFPSVHGVLNACYFQSITMFMYLYLKVKDRKYLKYVILLLFWPVLMIGRGILLGAFIQILSVYFLVNRATIKHYVSLAVGGILVILFFGLLGNFRTSYGNPFDYLLVTEKAVTIFKTLPSGFMWVYIYATSGLSNIFYNIETIVPSHSMVYSFSNLVPSAIKTFLKLNPKNDLLQLVDPTLNTSTIYAGFISDFGAWGGFFFVALIQAFCCYFYFLSVKKRPWGFFSYAVVAQVLIFSVFYDMFFLLPTLFQLFICLVMYLFFLREEKLNKA